MYFDYIYKYYFMKALFFLSLGIKTLLLFEPYLPATCYLYLFENEEYKYTNNHIIIME